MTNDIYGTTVALRLRRRKYWPDVASNGHGPLLVLERRSLLPLPDTHRGYDHLTSFFFVDSTRTGRL
jgi:hypothetical protein